MLPRGVLAVLLVALFALPGVTPLQACCDWTPQDREFWDKMYENPQKFSYDMGARPAHFRIRVGEEEEVVNPASAGRDELWRHILHHLTSGHPEGSHRPAQEGGTRK
jgi:hypothetical protein